MREITTAALPIWGRLDTIKELTGAPDNWLYNFAASHPEATRKFGNGHTNGTLIFNVAKVCEAIEGMGAPEKPRRATADIIGGYDTRVVMPRGGVR